MSVFLIKGGGGAHILRVCGFNFWKGKQVLKVANREKFGAFVKNNARNEHKRALSRDLYAIFMKIKGKIERFLSFIDELSFDGFDSTWLCSAWFWQYVTVRDCY